MLLSCTKLILVKLGHILWTKCPLVSPLMSYDCSSYLSDSWKFLTAAWRLPVANCSCSWAAPGVLVFVLLLEEVWLTGRWRPITPKPELSQWAMQLNSTASTNVMTEVWIFRYLANGRKETVIEEEDQQEVSQTAMCLCVCFVYVFVGDSYTK